LDEGPAAFPIVVVAQNQAIACLIETNQIAVLRLPTFERLAEVGIDRDSHVCLLGDPARLLVLAPTGTLHVVDPNAAEGPVEVAAMAMAPGSQFLATSGSYALVTGSNGLTVVNSQDLPSFGRFSTRVAIDIAAAMTPDHFLVQNAGVLEEWSGPVRAPLRRFRLDHSISALHLGGGARFLWFVTHDAPAVIVVVALTGMTPPVKIELAEPAAVIISDGGGLQLAVIGAKTRTLWVVTLATRTVTLVASSHTVSVAWRGQHDLVRVTNSTVELVPIARPNGSSSPAEVSVVLQEPPTRPMSTGQQLAAWKQRVMRPKESGATKIDEQPVASSTPPVTPPVENPSHPPQVLESMVALYQWRDALASWVRATLRGLHGDPPLLAACPLHDVCLRLGLEGEARLVLWLVYGARLVGENGVAPADLVELCPKRWDDALGRSRLGSLGAFEWRDDNRVHLAVEIKAALDELPPLLGTMIESSIAVTRRIAAVAPDGEDFVTLGRWIAPEVGAVIAPTERGLREPDRFLREAQVRAMAPLIPVSWFATRAMPNIPSVIIVPDHAAAKRFELEVVATYPG
jgi:hypothetical protein